MYVPKVLVISSSPRKNGNSELLAKESVRGATDAGAHVDYVRITDLKISPCTSCGYCEKKGECSIKDDFPELMRKMIDSDILVFATPIYFMAVGAWGKMAIDRCQTLWSRKYVLNMPNRKEEGKTWAGLCIAVGGSKSTKMFECVRLTMKYFYDVLDITRTDEIFHNRIDEKGAVSEKPEALEEAYNKTRDMVTEIAEKNTG